MNVFLVPEIFILNNSKESSELDRYSIGIQSLLKEMLRLDKTKLGSSKHFDGESFYDKLTQLPNQHLLYDRLEQIMASSKRTGRYLTLISINLIDFQPLNDSHNQEIGDLLIVEVANRLKYNVREVDTVARTGSDEFIIVLYELSREKTQSVTQSHIIAEKILTALISPYSVIINAEKDENNVYEYNCTVSLGVVVATNDNQNRDDLLELAESAVNKAKESGKNKICFSSTDI